MFPFPKVEESKSGRVRVAQLEEHREKRWGCEEREEEGL
jgi:hypothetical protein